ncbi:MAG TPA: Maf family protein [Caldilineaceae bacterium]|nr:Maf family protein [Caldilineaceae bacterium]
MSYHLVLASASPRRQQFLRDLGLNVQLLPADIDETPLSLEAPRQLAWRLAAAKARASAARLGQLGSPALVIAADTVVALGDQVLGKPADAAEAFAMLATLRGRVHEVHSGVSLYEPGRDVQRTRVNTTRVEMRAYSDAEIAAYIATGDPFDKAGAYAIQHRLFAPVAAVQGCISGVIGLPLADLRDLLASFGVTLPQPVLAVCQTQTDFPCCQAV